MDRPYGLGAWNRLFTAAFGWAAFFTCADFLYLLHLAEVRPTLSFALVLILRLGAFTFSLFYIMALIVNGCITLGDQIPAFGRSPRARALFFAAVSGLLLLPVAYLLFQGAGISKYSLSRFGPFIAGFLFLAGSFALFRALTALRDAARPANAHQKFWYGVLLAANFLSVAFYYWVTSHLFIRGYTYIHVALVFFIVGGCLLGSLGIFRLFPRPDGRRLLAALGIVLNLAVLGGATGYGIDSLKDDPQIQYLISNHAILTRRYLHLYFVTKDFIRRKVYAGKFEKIYQDLERLPFDSFREPEALPPSPFRGKAQGFNLLWITIDTLRYDHLSAYGYPRPTSPFLDELAKGSWMFKRAFSQYPYTNYSFVSFWHSRFFPKQADEELPLIGTKFKERGYRTVWVSPIPGVKPLSQDFASMEILKRVPAETITDRALEYLEKFGKDPFLLFLHYFEPHLSYDTSGPDYHYFGDKKPDIYDSAIRITDQQVGRVLARLKERGLDQKTVVVVHADHGVETWERGSWTHAFTVYNEMLRVPLIIHVPGLPASTPDPLVRLADVTPTLFELFDIPSEKMFEGQSLLPVIDGTESKERLVFARRDEYLESARQDNWKIIHHLKEDTYELYDLKQDLGEKNNLIAQERARALALQDLLMEFRYLYNSKEITKRFRKGVDVARLGRIYEATSNPVKKRALLNIIGYSPSREALRLFVKTLGEDSEDLRKLAALKLRLFPFVEAEEALARTASTDSATGVRMAALASLAEIRPQRARQLFEDLLRDKTTPAALAVFGTDLLDVKKQIS